MVHTRFVHRSLANLVHFSCTSNLTWCTCTPNFFMGLDLAHRHTDTPGQVLKQRQLPSSLAGLCSLGSTRRGPRGHPEPFTTRGEDVFSAHSRVWFFMGWFKKAGDGWWVVRAANDRQRTTPCPIRLALSPTSPRLLWPGDGHVPARAVARPEGAAKSGSPESTWRSICRSGLRSSGSRQRQEEL